MKRRTLASFLLALCVFAQPDWKQIRNRPLAFSTEYNWFRTIGIGASGSLSTPGAKSVNFANCPAGVYYSADYPLRVKVSSGAGAEEPALELGTTCGTGTPGNEGTIRITTTLSHTGTITIGTASSGVGEAIAAIAAAGGGTVTVPPGTHVVYAKVILRSNVALVGTRGASVIKVADGAWGATAAWAAGGTVGVSTIIDANGVTKWTIRGLTIDGNSANQSLNPSSAVIYAWNATDSVIEDNELINNRDVGAQISDNGPNSTRNTIQGNFLFGPAAGAGGTCSGGILVQGTNKIIRRNLVSGMCDDSFIANGTDTSDVLFEGNTVIGHASPDGFHAEQSSRVKFIGNTCIGGAPTYVATCFASACPSCSGGIVQTGNQFIGNTVYGCQSAGISITAETGSYSQKNMVVVGNELNGGDACGAGIVVSDDVQNVSVSSNVIEAFADRGILLNASGTSVKYAALTGNTIRNIGAGAGISLFASSGTEPGGENVTITGNTIVDDNSPHTQAYGISIINAAPTKMSVTGNIILGATETVYQNSGFAATADYVFSGNITDKSDSMINYSIGTPFGGLGTPADGTTIYCNDCVAANPCADSGTGAFAKRLAGAWVCN